MQHTSVRAADTLGAPEHPQAEPASISPASVHASLLDLHPHLAALKQLFSRCSSEEIGHFQRSELGLSNGKDYYMPARIGEYDGLKWISSRPQNTQHGLERSQSSITIRDAVSGIDRYQLPAVEITPAKTALVTMIALEAWLNAVDQPITLGLIGGGSVIRNHLKAAHQLFGDTIQRTRIYSNGTSAERLVGEHGLNYGCELATRQEILTSCNVIISATTSSRPLLEASELTPPERARFIAGVGFNDIDMSVFQQAATILTDDPVGYLSHQDYRLAAYLADDGAAQLHGLSELLRGTTEIPQHGLTLMMPFGTAMADLAVSLEILGINPWPQIS